MSYLVDISFISFFPASVLAPKAAAPPRAATPAPAAASRRSGRLCCSLAPLGGLTRLPLAGELLRLGELRWG